MSQTNNYFKVVHDGRVDSLHFFDGNDQLSAERAYQDAQAAADQYPPRPDGKTPSAHVVVWSKRGTAMATGPLAAVKLIGYAPKRTGDHRDADQS